VDFQVLPIWTIFEKNENMMGGGGSIKAMQDSLKDNNRLRPAKKKLDPTSIKTGLPLDTIEAPEELLKKIREEMQTKQRRNKKILMLIMISLILIAIVSMFFLNTNIRIKGINGY
jgi:predicted nucleic acid-binding Zn ribbon protein